MMGRFTIAVAFAMALGIPAVVSTGVPAAYADEASSQAYMAADKKMMDAMMSMKPSGDADKDFAMMMIPHHQGAIDMAEVELKYGKDAELKKMAQKIIDAQRKEIKEFEEWQKKHAM